jgi:aminoglycoside phosphotransferase (APT) family kinase protein
MTTIGRRDDDALARGIASWCAQRRPDAHITHVTFDRPSAGWSNETLLVTTDGDGPDARFVVRLPPLVPTWPAYDLAGQATLLDALANDLPVPRVLAFEPDERWLDAPFLVMALEPGTAGPESPAFDAALMAAPEPEQRALHETLVATLARIHRVDWRARGLDRVVRGGEESTAREVDWWREYVDWAADGEPTPALRDAIAWCAATVPASEPPASLCWGDARIGNLLFGPDRSLTSVLDWELATIGPAESDVGWYLALEELMARFGKRTVPGFFDRDAFVERYERALGRPVRDLEWHEIFALIRSVAINERQARLAAEAGVAYPGVAGPDNPVLRILHRKIERAGS